ncbi:MAG: TIGR04211 family SH3 domain-containing protein [Pseudomonadota bacterium]
MQQTTRLGALVLLCMLSGAVFGQDETAYVTDVLRLGLHQAADTSDRAFRSLESGQQMTVLERNSLYARVRLPDGTEGWVKAGFLVEDPPARFIVAEVTERADAVQAELDALQQSSAGALGRVADLERQLTEAQTTLETAQVERDASLEELQSLRDRMRAYGFSLPWPVALGGLVVALLLGFAGGFWWIDSRSRKRHGGFRIY